VRSALRYVLPLPLAAAAVSACAVAYAGFTGGAAATQSLGTATLLAPSDPAAAPGTCVAGSHDAAALSWTATPSTWADGYEVLRATDSAGPYAVVATVTGVTYADSGLAFATTYHYAVRATKSAWRSAPTATVSLTTRATDCA
jgi:hypothetical protein